jgi:hypothetical protein
MTIALLSLQFINSSNVCTSSVPSVDTDCFNQSSSNDELCCYLSSINTSPNSQFCLSIPSSAFTGDSIYAYNNVNYNIACKSQGLNSILESCSGISGSVAGCSTGSSFTNSCCYYQKTDTGSLYDKVQNTPTGCYWIGTKFTGSLSWAGLPLNCSANFLTFSASLVFFVFLFLF